MKRWLSGLGVLLLLAGCLPIPDLRADLKLPTTPYRMNPQRVKTTYLSLPGYEAPGTPRRLNRSFYLRYHAGEKARVILILMPGIFGGAASFDIVARQLVASSPGLEVWAVDRRANALEDRSALTESLRRRDPSVAYRYYLQNAGTAAGFNVIPAARLGFMRRWGLVAHLHDLHEVVKRANERAETVVLGGHSLGASMVALYAAYRFEEGLGDTLLDGLLLLDGTLGRTGAFGFTKGLLLGNLELVPPGAGFDAGRGPPYLTFGAGPDFYAAFAVQALMARLRPNAPAPDVPFAMTNLARLGLRADEDYAPSAVPSVSVGEAVGARYGGNIAAFVLDGPQSRSSRTVAGVADGYEAVGWTQGDRSREYTDIVAYLRARVTAQSDYNEWYFPLRLLVDMGELPLDLGDRDDFSAHSEVGVPTLAVGAGRGLVTTLDGFSAYSNLRASALFSSYVVPGYTHLDIVSARENPVVPLFNRWLAQITQLRRNE
jgi:pimeloyl-ACP methyl ester carboxylesterase